MKIYKKNKEYHSSEHLVYKCHYHVIFCPKYRRSILIGKVSDRLKEICYEVADTYDFEIIEMETDKNHIHLLISCNPRFGTMSCITALKSIFAKTLFKEFSYIKKNYLWGGGGGKFWSRISFVSKVGAVYLEILKKYIENQGK